MTWQVFYWKFLVQGIFHFVAKSEFIPTTGTEIRVPEPENGFEVQLEKYKHRNHLSRLARA